MYRELDSNWSSVACIQPESAFTHVLERLCCGSTFAWPGQVLLQKPGARRANMGQIGSYRRISNGRLQVESPSACPEPDVYKAWLVQYSKGNEGQFLKLPTLFKARVTVEPEGDGTYINRAPVRRSASYNVLLVAHGGGIFDLCLAARDMSGEDVAQSSLGTPARRVWSATRGESRHGRLAVAGIAATA
ncbi:hypothetical protein IEO21_08837 [Rhodonia placenta]|uniref:Uncharacterized protein n=1 Tax=Rhodonia placenta TaxID=104341 RepID=A0A8H7NVF9_9APHY|nr:hypothetical protein IEO21_08837 [Postia placenta]